MTQAEKRLGRGLRELGLSSQLPTSSQSREAPGSVGKDWEESGKRWEKAGKRWEEVGKSLENQLIWPGQRWEGSFSDQLDPETIDHGRLFIEYMQLSGGSGQWEALELYEQYEWWCGKVTGRVPMAEQTFANVMNAIGIIGARLPRSVCPQRRMARTIPERQEG